MYFFIKLGRDVNHGERIDPIDFGGQRSKVKVTVDTYWKKLWTQYRLNLCVLPYQSLYLWFQTETDSPDIVRYEVVGVQSQSQIDKKKAGMSLQGLGGGRHIPDDIQTPQDPEEESGM